MIKTIGLSEDLSSYLVDLLIKKAEESPLEAAKIQVILPTRRACLAVKNAFLKRSQTHSFLLPQLLPLYELDDLAENIPEALSKLERILYLTKLCAGNTPPTEQTIKMAISLGDLLDEFYQFETDKSKLPDLVQKTDFAEHWNKSLSLFSIITEKWPEFLRQKLNRIDETERRIKLIDAYTNRVKNTDQTVIVAGVDGGLPAARRLMSAVNKMKNGLIILEGLDTTLTDEDVKQIPPHHYQAGLLQILGALHKSPTEIERSAPISPAEQLVAEALKPESQTNTWRTGHLSKESLSHVTRIDCDTTTDEAVTIALLLRGVLEKPDQTGALVTPDRNLARRVIIEMKRWGITLDDSAGTPLSRTETGTFLRLIAKVAAEHEQVSDLLSLYKHPLAADGRYPTSFRQSIKETEKKSRKKRIPWTPDISTDIKMFTTLFDNSNVLIPFKKLLETHIRVAEALATSSDRSGAERLWGNPAGKAVFDLITSLLDKADIIEEIEPASYASILDIFLETATTRPIYGMTPRLDILGPIEARFHHPDVCIIGGLNEGTFPQNTETGPWLNRPMRASLKMPPPETKIATESMDFAHCFCGKKVFLTRTKKNGGAETIPSRFLSRMEAALMGSNLKFPIHVNNWQALLDKPLKADPVIPPAPCPPTDIRPKKISVTNVEKWLRNPYAIYAEYILQLFSLPPLGQDKTEQTYGTAIHKALENFIKKKSDNCDMDSLLKLAEQAMKETYMTPADQAFYLPRFKTVLNFIQKKQEEIIGQIQDSIVEEKGTFTFDVDGKPFTLEGKADRIDIFKDGSTRIVDYKTGNIPTLPKVKSGYYPQLPLEALLLERGGFPSIPATQINSLEYWVIAPEKKNLSTLTKKEKGSELANEAFEGLKGLIHIFNDPKIPYLACPTKGEEPTYDDYEHLSRIKEWDQGEDE